MDWKPNHWDCSECPSWDEVNGCWGAPDGGCPLDVEKEADK